jgi:hypothetical protein
LIQTATVMPVGSFGSTPNDPLFSDQWALYNTGQDDGTPGADINILPAWEITKGSDSVIIGILDTGIPYDSTTDSLLHEDLNDPNRIIVGFNYVDSTTNVGSGGINHGTEVAGVALAETNNSLGIAGVAHNAQGLIMKVGSFTANEDSLPSWICAFDNAVRFAAEYADSTNQKLVINYSVGFKPEHIDNLEGAKEWLRDIADYAADRNIVIVSITHNDGADSIRYPGALSDEYHNIIAVAATNHKDERYYTSNYGAGVVISAPGEDVMVTSGGGYGLSGKTSIAAPHVSGVIALMLSINQDLTYSEIRDILINTADKVGQYQYVNGWNQYLGHGRLNAYQALKYTIENYGATLGGPGESVTFNDEFTIQPGVDLTILGGTTFTLKSGTVLNLSSNLVVENGASMAIEEGVTINFMENNVRIISDGLFSANGTSSDRIVFDHNGHSGNWIEAKRGAQIQHADIIGVRTDITGTGSHHAFITDTHFKNPPVNLFFSNLQYVDFYRNYIENAGLYFWNQPDINMQRNTIENAGIAVSLWNSELAEFHRNVVEGSSILSLELMFGSDGFLVNLDEDDGRNRLKANEGEGEIYVGSNAQLFIGDQWEPTNNTIYNEDPDFLIENENSSHQVKARHTYWGSSSAPPSYLFDGWVDYSNHNGSDQTGSSGSPLAKTAGTGQEARPEQRRREMLLELISELEQDAYRQGNDRRLNDLYLYMRMDRGDRMGLRGQILETIDEWSQRRSEITGSYGDAPEVRRAVEAALLLKVRLAFRDSDYERAEALNEGYGPYIQTAENRVALQENRVSAHVHRGDYVSALQALDQGRLLAEGEPFYNEGRWDFVEAYLKGRLGKEEQGSGYEKFADEAGPDPLDSRPQTIALLNNYPNPFNPVTQIPFELPGQARVHLAVYDVLGRQVAVLADRVYSSGRHQVSWDASGQSSGVYVVHMTATPQHGHPRQLSRQVMLVK